jgi:hypothetical protein
MVAAGNVISTEGLNNSLDYLQWELEAKLDQKAEDILADQQDDPNVRAAERGRAAYLAAKTKVEPSSMSLGAARAVLVEKVRREIIVISQSIELQEDYDDNIRGGKAPFSSFVTVSVCDQHNDLCDKLCAIKTTSKPRIIDLACEIAARMNGNGKSVLPKTFHDAHKRYGAAARKLLNRR